MDQSDCTVVSDRKDALSIARQILQEDRRITEIFIREHPGWQESLIPMRTPDAPPIIAAMEEAGELAGVGPMAAIAGVFADHMVTEMQRQGHAEIAVVENGGEIAIQSAEDIIIALYVLTTALKAKIGFRYHGGDPMLGLGTSSGQFGHAMSLGEGDAVTVFADSAGLADAAATQVCNAVVGDDYEQAILRGLEVVDTIPGVHGAFIARGGFVGQKGKLPELVRIHDGEQVILAEKFKPV